MHYKLIIIFISMSFLSGQSLFNRWIGSDPFTGSARSTSMGHTHLLNSTGSTNVRFNPANLIKGNSSLIIDMQMDRFSIFERWSMPMRDSFGEFLTNADYVANEFSQFGLRGGLSVSINILKLGEIGLGLHTAPLSHFTYHYLEEVRGSNQIEVGEYASKDPIIGYHNLKSSGLLQVSSLGAGVGINFFNLLNLSIGMSLNQIHESLISDIVEIDTLYSDVTNLSTFPDIHQESKLSKSNFIIMSAQCKLNSNIIIASSWEESTIVNSNNYNWTINSTNGLFQYWDDGNYAINGLNYLKPEIFSFGVTYISNQQGKISINFELNQISYHNHLNLNDYKSFKFGFEYITIMGTPIRGGLTYKTPMISSLEPLSMFTFGTGKTIENLILDLAGTYSLQSFKYPDLFLVEGDVRTDYDLVRDSQLNLSLSLTYQF